MWTWVFWKQVVERAVKTAAQAAVAFFVIGTTSALDVDWVTVGGIAGAAAIASVLTSLASAPFGPAESPSIVKVDQ